MIDPIHIALALCLLATNFHRLLQGLNWLSQYLPAPQIPPNPFALDPTRLILLLCLVISNVTHIDWLLSYAARSMAAMNPVHLVLMICLLLTNLPNINRALDWVRAYIFQPPNERLVPLYDREGELIGMVRIRENIQDRSTNQIDASRFPEHRASASDTPHTNPPPAVPSIPPAVQMSTPALNRSHIPLTLWNGWPDGDVWTLFPQQELTQSQGMIINWVGEAIAGNRDRGSKKAAVWQKGKQLHRRCMGALRCQSRACSSGLVCAPATRGIDLHQQLTKLCSCGDKIELQPCGVEWTTYLFREGAYFTHTGAHTHGKYTHSLNYRPRAPFQFEEFVSKYNSSSENMVSTHVSDEKTLSVVQLPASPEQTAALEDESGSEKSAREADELLLANESDGSQYFPDQDEIDADPDAADSDSVSG
ncbi:hypothetical protein R3P38DRAFT_1741040 [Favolaschia claudopus]|uniref:Uncharacterized protein n=1 Tax=Favolaschia claudopus TaxID=2862362 RepID=A0AAW0DFX4_9AGAR